MIKLCVTTAFVLLVGAVSLSQAQPVSTFDHANDANVSATPAAPVDAATLQCELTPQQFEALLPQPKNETCLMCGSGSSGSCAKKSGKARVQCKGSRKSCKSKGCKITGTASCSSSANVQTC